MFTGTHKAETKHLYHPSPSHANNVHGAKARATVGFKEI